MKQTNLARKMMDFGDRKNGVENYTTAADMAQLLEKKIGDIFYHVNLQHSSVPSKRCAHINYIAVEIKRVGMEE